MIQKHNKQNMNSFLQKKCFLTFIKNIFESIIENFVENSKLYKSKVVFIPRNQF